MHIVCFVLCVFSYKEVSVCKLTEIYLYRLELATLSVQKDNAMIRQVYDMLHLVWKTYHFSAKSMRELKAIGEDLGVDVLVPGGVKGT